MESVQCVSYNILLKIREYIYIFTVGKVCSYVQCTHAVHITRYGTHGTQTNKLHTSRGVAYPFKLFYDPRINHRTFFQNLARGRGPVVCSPCVGVKSSSSSYSISIILLCIIIVPSACECCVPRMLVACCLLCGKRNRSFIEACIIDEK